MFYAEIVEQTLPQPLQAPFHAAVCDIVYSDVMTVKEKKCIGVCWIVIKIKSINHCPINSHRTTTHLPTTGFQPLHFDAYSAATIL